MSRVFVIKDETSKTKFALAIAKDDGTITETKPINRMQQESTGAWTLILPENPLGRRYISLKKAQGSDVVELIEPIVKVSSGESTPRKPLENYLEGEDRELYLKLKAKAIAKMNENTALEKAKAIYERAKAEYEKLLNGGV